MKNVCILIFLAFLWSCSDDSYDECPDIAETINFNIVDEATKHDLVFGEHSIYNINELKMLGYFPPDYYNKDSTLTEVSHTVIRPDKGPHIQTLVIGLAGRYILKLNEEDSDTLTFSFSTQKSGECNDYDLEVLKHNGRIVCNDCRSGQVYTIYK